MTQRSWRCSQGGKEKKLMVLKKKIIWTQIMQTLSFVKQLHSEESDEINLFNGKQYSKPGPN